MSKSTLITSAVVGAILSVALSVAISAPAGAVVVIAGFGALIGALVGVGVTNFVPFDFKRLRGNAPRPALPNVYDDTIAKENGSNLSRTPLAKVFAVLMGVGIVSLFVATYSAITTPQPAQVANIAQPEAAAHTHPH